MIFFHYSLVTHSARTKDVDQTVARRLLFSDLDKKVSRLLYLFRSGWLVDVHVMLNNIYAVVYIPGSSFFSNVTYA